MLGHKAEHRGFGRRWEWAPSDEMRKLLMAAVWLSGGNSIFGVKGTKRLPSQHAAFPAAILGPDLPVDGPPGGPSGMPPF